MDDASHTPESEGRTRVETRAESGALLSVAWLGPDGTPDGEFTTYAPDGTLQMRMLYRAGLPDGPAVILRNGTRQTEMTYADGLLDGEMRGYDLAGRLLSVVRYAAGRRSGTMECFTPDGKPLLASEYRDDRLNGATVEFYEDGTVRRRTVYKDDLPEGEAMEFHPSGNPRERTLYKAGILVEGPQRFEDPQGPGKSSLLTRLLGK